MADLPFGNVMSAEQLMLTKMDAMRIQASPEFVVTANPVDIHTVNEPMSFSTAMTDVLNKVNDHQSLASSKMTAVETGESDDLVGAMIASQKASLSFNALLQVRNKVVGSFEDIMKMPV
ncbi:MULTISPECIES: flagellar hook-basal body complex protein FliE [Vibrio]|uniref:Flagellar hook-basal body complex protein FliE n=1 Tax=Vibrio diazotrophicus TaxID=685 RepID=A0A2J8FYL6_VIBDI|nr:MULTISPECIES: flagellar hook-basal body complex protein FliE [Vibrio]MCF7364158.1 flagellar hook-basal body complex protein FliE [Vibrio sp. A1-b2]PNH78848.1 flagellar hook-basal body complex protein FliE [Vibrio diazotrophicus]PNI02106.1 flagellar hook-basal body complex protein FliE [Vibrio diazotrophicus]PNI02542.1 flagellar hook-basal body complex protein FliE [Vibrio diazotrophicus]RAS62814.1 flagellar hook-basal body complex protein FliE [Vibrio diazotrophicus]